MTAVEWLLEKYKSQNTLLFSDDFEQALEMEKQQIKDAFQYKFLHPYVENEPEQYYNETYGDVE
jgi:hypothetical protein